jgi:hypothetical protein
MAERLRGFFHAPDGKGADPVRDHYYELQTGDPGEPQIWAYTGRPSYGPGEVLELHVSTTCSSYRVAIRRDGTGDETVWQSDEMPGAFHAAPANCSAAGCGWPVALRLEVPADWASDGYLVILEGEHPAGPARHAHVVLIRAAPDSPAPMLLIACTGTWVAYNEWGGSNHYEGITGPEGRDFSPVLSTQRPWTRGFAELPSDAPRIPCDAPPPGAPPAYPHMHWAHATGHSKKYASAGWASYERPFLQWCARAGYEIDVASQYDLQSAPELLSRYGKCAMPSISFSTVAEGCRGSPGTSTGKPVWRTMGGGRFATNTGRARRTLCATLTGSPPHGTRATSPGLPP